MTCHVHDSENQTSRSRASRRYETGETTPNASRRVRKTEASLGTKRLRSSLRNNDSEPSSVSPVVKKASPLGAAAQPERMAEQQGTRKEPS